MEIRERPPSMQKISTTVPLGGDVGHPGAPTNNTRNITGGPPWEAMPCIRYSEKFAFSLMTCAKIFGNAWVLIDNRHTCDHRIDASINTMK
jgi:hypothetical protein